MEKLIIQTANVLFPNSEFHKEKIDILIENGKITNIHKAGSIVKGNAKIIQAEGMILAPAFFDLNVNFGEPGLETKEDMLSGCAAAVAGGFSGLALQPNTIPPLQSRSEIAYIKNIGESLMVDIHPVGTVSKERKGENLAELYDMKLSGAIAFSDGNHTIQQSSLMSRALLYSKGFDGLIFSFAEDFSISGNTKMNEGIVSTLLGMKGNPNLAEEIMVARDLFLAEYNEARIHFSTISTAGAVKLIREAKDKGIQVTCDVAAHHLVLTDESVESFDSNFKVRPPLRSELDRVALINGLKDGTIDAIVSQHTPHEIEFKNVEFEKAEFGITGLQTVLPLVLKAGLSLDLIIEKLSINPRKILNIPQPELAVGANANFILFNPDEIWIFDKQTNRSKANNNPYFNSDLKGRVSFLINKNQYYIS
jgi:dihydroorotase